jgi:hypothetical protein
VTHRHEKGAGRSHLFFLHKPMWAVKPFHFISSVQMTSKAGSRWRTLTNDVLITMVINEKHVGLANLGHEKPNSRNQTELSENRTELPEPIGFGS